MLLIMPFSFITFVYNDSIGKSDFFIIIIMYMLCWFA